jgi:hypothetical protein
MADAWYVGSWSLEADGKMWEWGHVYKDPDKSCRGWDRVDPCEYKGKCVDPTLNGHPMEHVVRKVTYGPWLTT